MILASLSKACTRIGDIAESKYVADFSNNSVEAFGGTLGKLFMYLKDICDHTLKYFLTKVEGLRSAIYATTISDQ